MAISTYQPMSYRYFFYRIRFQNKDTEIKVLPRMPQHCGRAGLWVVGREKFQGPLLRGFLPFFSCLSHVSSCLLHSPMMIFLVPTETHFVFQPHVVSLLCLQWARDEFEGLFKQPAENVNQYLT